MSADGTPQAPDRMAVMDASSHSMFRIADRRFRIVEACFGYRLALRQGGWRSMIDVEVLARPDPPGASAQETRVKTSDLYLAAPPPEGLRGFSIDVDALDTFDTWPCVELSQGDCQIVDSARLDFGSFDGERVHVELQGNVDLVRDDGSCAYDAPLRLIARARFAHVVVDEGWLVKAWARLGQHFDRAVFDEPVRREDGAHVFRRKITP